MNLRTGPWSRAGRYRSSPVFIAWRILPLDSVRARRRAAACSLRVRGTLARALRAASASRLDGVGRPFFCVVSEPSSTPRSAGLWAGVSDAVLVRRNNVCFLARLDDVRAVDPARRDQPTVALEP